MKEIQEGKLPLKNFKLSGKYRPGWRMSDLYWALGGLSIGSGLGIVLALTKVEIHWVLAVLAAGSFLGILLALNIRDTRNER